MIFKEHLNIHQAVSSKQRGTKNIVVLNLSWCDAVAVNGREHEWTVYCVDLSTCFNKTEKFLSFIQISLWQNTPIVAHVDSSHVPQNFHSQHFTFQWKLLVDTYSRSLRTANLPFWRPELHVDDGSSVRSSAVRGNFTSGRRPLASSSPVLKVSIRPTGFL